MDSINAFNGYRKVKETEQEPSTRRRRRAYTVSVAIAIAIILLVIAAIALIATRVCDREDSSADSPTSSPISNSINSICSATRYPAACISSLSSTCSDTHDPVALFRQSMKVARDEILKISTFPPILAAQANEKVAKAAIADCQTMFEDAIQNLNSSLTSIEVGRVDGKLLSPDKVDDLKTWLSAAVTDLETCMDGLGEVSTEFQLIMASSIKNSTQFVSNSLAISTKVFSNP